MTFDTWKNLTQEQYDQVTAAKAQEEANGKPQSVKRKLSALESKLDEFLASATTQAAAPAPAPAPTATVTQPAQPGRTVTRR